MGLPPRGREEEEEGGRKRRRADGREREEAATPGPGAAQRPDHPARGTREGGRGSAHSAPAGGDAWKGVSLSLPHSR